MGVWRNWLPLASSRWFVPWKFRQRITAESKKWCVKLFVQDITTQLRSFPPSLYPRLFSEGYNPGTVELTKFLCTSPLTQVRLSRLCTSRFCAIPCQPYSSNFGTPSQLCWSLSPQSYPLLRDLGDFVHSLGELQLLLNRTIPRYFHIVREIKSQVYGKR